MIVLKEIEVDNSTYYDVKMTLCILPYLSFHRIIPSPIQQLLKPLMCCTLENVSNIKYSIR